VVRNREPVEPQRLDADGVVVLLAPRKFFAECERAVLRTACTDGNVDGELHTHLHRFTLLDATYRGEPDIPLSGCAPAKPIWSIGCAGSHMGDDSTVTADDIAQYAKRARFDPNRFDPDERTAAIDAQDELMTLSRTSTCRQRLIGKYWDPAEGDDPNGAFLTRCDLRRTDEGVLSGLTVAIKDNIAVAGIPMTCGSPLFEDYIPAEDATVVDRILAAGADPREVKHGRVRAWRRRRDNAVPPGA